MILHKHAFSKKSTLAAALTAALLLPTSSFAAPAGSEDAAGELNAILTAQQAQAADSLLEETLGLSELGKTASENGLQWQFTGGLLPETAALLELPAEWSDTTFSLNGKIDPKLKKYLFEAALQHASDALLNLSCYGDENLLAVALPQFYSGNLALRSGNLKEQYRSSDLSNLTGADLLDELPDLNLHFYPQPAASTDSPVSNLQAAITELRDSTSITKETSNGIDIYTATLHSDQIISLYRVLFQQLFAPIESLTYVSYTGAGDLDEQIEEILASFQSVLPDEIPVQFEVEDQLLQRIRYTLDMDVNALDTLDESYDDPDDDRSDMDGLYDNDDDRNDNDMDDLYDDDDDRNDMDDLYDDDARDETHDFDFQNQTASFSIGVNESVSDLPKDVDTVSCSYELAFANPENLSEGYDFFANVGYDTDPSALMSVYLAYRQQQENGTESAALTLGIDADGESVYFDTPYVMQFDPASNTLDAMFSVTDSDTSETVSLFFSGSFSDVEKGKSFRLSVDDFSLNNAADENADPESLGITAELSVNADPGDIPAPTDCRYLLEMDQNALLSLFMECSANAETWSQLYAPDLEEEIESEASEISGGQGAVSTSIIGGADGPTAIFLAGKLG